MKVDSNTSILKPKDAVNDTGGRTPGFRDSNLRLDSMMTTETVSTPRRRLQDATLVRLDGRRSLILNKIDATRCKPLSRRQVGFCRSSETFGQWCSQ